MIIAVTKDANNHILPVAYAIVDEETVHSWCWFFEQFREFVAFDKRLCYFRQTQRNHPCNAMEHLDGWKEQFACHRFCLRHIRSNFMQKFKNVRLKKLCWAVGSTTQQRKYKSCVREIKDINPEAQQYLKTIGKSKWCLLHDNNRRWGCLTTNIAESFNNVLRGARHLPIKACIDLTFNRIVQLFRKYSEAAMNCNTPLPSRMWSLYNICS